MSRGGLALYLKQHNKMERALNHKLAWIFALVVITLKNKTKP